MSTLRAELKKDLAGEAKAIRDYTKRAKDAGLSARDKSIIQEIIKDEKSHHGLLTRMLERMRGD